MKYKTSTAITLIALLFVPMHVMCETSNEQDSARARLHEKYHAIAQQLHNNTFRHPIVIESDENNGHMRGDIYSLMEHPFARASKNLTQAENWCEVVPLHLNVKACTYSKRKFKTQLTFYSGRKYYDPPGRTFRLRYDYAVVALQNDYFKIQLTADSGPLHTENYLILFEAIPHADGTFIHFSYSYRYKLMARMANTAYLVGLGNRKVGFSVVGTDKKGKPKYIRGIKGIIERNAVRYFLAVDAFLDTLDIPVEQRFEQRIARWYDLTNLYPTQLYELQKQDYLRYKRKERAQQLRLQRKLDQS